jgi:hypothetical protein
MSEIIVKYGDRTNVLSIGAEITRRQPEFTMIGSKLCLCSMASSNPSRFHNLDAPWERARYRLKI